MKRQINFKFLGKLCITCGLIFFFPYIYSLVKYLGEFASTSTTAEILVIIGWLWMIVGQVLLLAYLWEE